MITVNILEEISDKTESVWWSPDARKSYLKLKLIFHYFFSFFAYFKSVYKYQIIYFCEK